jgi:hypothetical protein
MAGVRPPAPAGVPVAANDKRTLDIHLGKVALYQLSYRHLTGSDARGQRWKGNPILHPFCRVAQKMARFVLICPRL